jgi:AraC-like DNA-binding protein
MQAQVMVETLVEPLSRFPLFRTSDPEELFHISSSCLGASHVELKSLTAFEARVNLVKLKSIGLAYGVTSCDLAADHCESDFIRVQVALRGRARISAAARDVDLDEQHIGVTPTGVVSRSACQAGHARLTLRLDQAALLHKLEALLGAKSRGNLMVEPAIDAGSTRGQCLFGLIDFLARQLNAEPGLPDAVCRELEQAVQVAFLHASRHSFSHLLERDEKAPSASLVNTIEGLIEANWRDAVDIENLAAQAGVSARTLFRLFRQARGYSPMAFAKSVRLRRAREMLLSGDPAISVTAVAFHCNFLNPGNFAREFREAFGERPSDTLVRARRIAGS